MRFPSRPVRLRCPVGLLVGLCLGVVPGTVLGSHGRGFDFNGDGRDDLLLRDPAVSTAKLRYGTATGFPGGLSVTLASSHPDTFLGDFDGDGRGDVLLRRPGGTVAYLKRGRASGFSGVTKVGLAAVYATVLVGDFDGDGLDDLLLRDPGDDLAKLRRSVAGTFPGGTSVTIPARYSQSLVGDFDGDGKQDVFYRDPADATALVRYGTASAFSAPLGVTVATSHDRVYLGDFDGDGRDDLLCRSAASASVEIFPGAASGFAAPVAASLDRAAYETFVGDFDGDGRDDVLVRDPTRAAASLSRGTLSGLAAGPSVVLPTGPLSVHPGDFDGNDRDDLFYRAPGAATGTVRFGTVVGVTGGTGVGLAASYTSVHPNFPPVDPPNQAPEAFLTSPLPGSVVLAGAPVSFTGFGSDADDGVLVDGDLSWQLQGGPVLGSGRSIGVTLTAGEYVFELTVIDSRGAGDTATATLTVAALASPGAEVVAAVDQWIPEVGRFLSGSATPAVTVTPDFEHGFRDLAGFVAAWNAYGTSLGVRSPVTLTRASGAVFDVPVSPPVGAEVLVRLPPVTAHWVDAGGQPRSLALGGELDRILVRQVGAGLWQVAGNQGPNLRVSGRFLADSTGGLPVATFTADLVLELSGPVSGTTVTTVTATGPYLAGTVPLGPGSVRATGVGTGTLALLEGGGSHLGEADLTHRVVVQLQQELALQSSPASFLRGLQGGEYVFDFFQDGIPATARKRLALSFDPGSLLSLGVPAPDPARFPALSVDASDILTTTGAGDLVLSMPNRANLAETFSPDLRADLSYRVVAIALADLNRDADASESTTVVAAATIDSPGPLALRGGLCDGDGSCIDAVVGFSAPQVPNAPPVLTLPGVQGPVEGSLHPLTGISVADSDAGASPLLLTLTVTQGTLDLGDSTGLSVAGIGTATFTAAGRIDDLNAALATLTYQPTGDFDGEDLLLVTADDMGASGAGGARTDSGSVDLVLQAVNDPPVLGLPGPQVVLEDQPLPAGGAVFALSVADPDATSLAMTLAVTQGSLVLPHGPLLAVTGNFTGSLSVSGPAGLLRQTLPNLRYLPAPDSSGGDRIDVTVSDQGGTGSGGVLQDAGAIDVTVLPVNDAPSFTPGSDVTVDEDAGLVVVASWATDVSVGPASEATQTPDFEVVSALPPGIVTGVTIAPDGELSFSTVADAHGTVSVTVRMHDDGGTANGGDDTTDDVVFAITVRSVNDVPSFVSGGNVLRNEDAGAILVSGWATNISVGPTDEATQTPTFTVVSALPAGIVSGVSVDPVSGDLSFSTVANANGTVTVTLRLSDDGGTANGGDDTADDVTFDLQILSVNDKPSVTPPASFNAIGNTTLVVSAGSGLLQGFSDPNDSPADATHPTTPVVITQAPTGTLTVNQVDGSFSFTPLAGSRTQTSFKYRVRDAGGTANGGVDLSDEYTVDVAIEDMIWWVQNDSSATPHEGTQAKPFTTLAELAGASRQAGDTIRIRRGNGTSTGLTSTITLLASERLIGAGVPVVIGSTTVEAADGSGGPTMLVASGNAVALATGNTVTGLTLGTSGGGIALSGGSVGTFSLTTATVSSTNGTGLSVTGGTVNASNTSIAVTGGPALSLVGTAGSPVALAGSFTSLSSSGSTAQGVNLEHVTGTLAVSGAATVTNATGPALRITGSATTLASNFAGTTTISQNASSGRAVEITSPNASASTTFANLAATTLGAAGVVATSGGTLHISAGSIAATGGPAIDLDATGGTWTLAGAVSSTNPGASPGIDITNAPAALNLRTTGTVTVTGGTGGTSSIRVVSPASGAQIRLGIGSTVTVNNRNGIGLDLIQGAGTLELGTVTVNNQTSVNALAAKVAGTTGGSVTLAALTANQAAQSADALSITTCTGSVTINGSGTLSNSTGDEIEVNGGSGNVTIASAVTNTASRSILVTGRTGGTVTISGNLTDTGQGLDVTSNTGGTIRFSGTSKSISSGAGVAVDLASNTGATIEFTNGGLVLTTTSGTGFNATGGGTVRVSGAGNTIGTNTGTALNVVSTTIATSAGAPDTGLRFHSISANGATNGIVLNTTGSNGGLTVTGDGGGSSNGSGGTIQNSTGTGILLTSTSSLGLGYMNIQNSGDSGIQGTGVSGFSLTRCNVLTNGNSTSDDGLRLGQPSGSVVGVTGTVAITNCSISGNAHNNVHIRNTSGTISSFTVTGSSFNNLNDTFGANAFLFEGSGTSVLNSGTISGSTFQNNSPQRALEVQGHDTASVGTFTVSGNSFIDNGIQASFTQDSSANVTFKFQDNGTPGTPMTGCILQAVNIFSSSQATGGTLVGTVSGNYIGNAAVAGSGSTGGGAISAVIQGQTAATLLIDGNVVRQTNGDSRAIACAFRGPANPLAGTLGPNTIVSDLTITNNDVLPGSAPSGFPLCTIMIEADNQSGSDSKSPKVRADVRGNSVPSTTVFDFFSEHIGFYEYDSAGAHGIGELVDTPPTSGTAQAQLQSTNTGTANAFGVALIAGPINLPP